MKMHFHFVTLFPDPIDLWFRTSIIGRAREKGLFEVSLYPLRHFADNPHRSVDDLAYGGGGGMVLRIEPLVAAVESIKEQFPDASVIYFCPIGKRMDQPLVQSIQSKNKHLILICGHYEGVDQRFIEGWVDHEISLADIVFSGGELAAMAFADAMVRHLDGTLASPEAPKNESFSLRDPKNGSHLLEYPHYTRPANFRGTQVPEVLLSGNHEKIQEWRLKKARELTKLRRPDLCT